MWWLPIAQFAQGKMAEKEAAKEAERQKEHARKLQIHSIRSSIAGQYGSPGYGEQAARTMYETEQNLAAQKRQQDAQRRQQNAKMIGDSIESYGDFQDKKEAKEAGEAAQRRQQDEEDARYEASLPPAYGVGSASPSPYEPERPLTPYEQAELERSRNALRGYR